MYDKCYSGYLPSEYKEGESNKMEEIKRKEKPCSVRMTDEEDKIVEEEAKKRGITKSEYIRKKVFAKERTEDFIYTKEFRECMENITDSVNELYEISGEKQKEKVNEMLERVGALWLFLNK